MARDRNTLNRAFGEAEAAFDWFKYRLRRRREAGRYHIQPYRGHGTADELHVSGRVFEGDPVPSAQADDASIRNFWHTMQRLGRDDVPAARLRATAGGESVTVLTDDEGYFEARLPATTATAEGGGEVWREIEIELLDPAPAAGRCRTQGFAIVPPAEARFGIISDIDDTVVHTDVANLMRMLRLVLLTNAHTRLPFRGVAAFYRALHAGTAGPFTNPVFYVSSSPWNFYDLLTEVFEVHRIPLGPLFLKDYGLARDLLLSRGHMEHKLGAIQSILDTHPQLRFVLVGDSGQKDPEVYRETVLRNPGRVEVVYIRDVSGAARDSEVRAIAETLKSAGSDMIFVRDTLAAAVDAERRGLIDAEGLESVRAQVEHDRNAPGPLQAALRR